MTIFLPPVNGTIGIKSKFHVANQPVKLPESKYISMIIVDEGPDIADDKIVEMVTGGDLVISEDIPLADRVIEKNAFVISTRGEF